MSKYQIGAKAVTLAKLAERYQKGDKLSVVTCYDASFARLIDQTEIDMVLVGDSLGNVMLGYDTTVSVTLAHMIHHTSAVSRVLSKPFLVADMPFGTYQHDVGRAVENAIRLVQDGGAQAVKLEGGVQITEQVKAIVAAGIPVMGHLGLTPQSVHQLGGYKVQGRDHDAALRMQEDAKALADAGCFSLVLELVPASLAKTITQSLPIPTIGIGAGPDCSGQVLVLHDLLGFDEGFKPKFLKKYAELSKTIMQALQQYDTEVKKGVFPSKEHSFED